MIASIDYATSPYPDYQYGIYEIREVSSSAPSLDIGEFFSFLKSEAATQPTQRKRNYAVIVEGLPLAISPKMDVESQIKASQDDSGALSPVTFTERLDLIKERLALSITQVAELFCVTRKAIYDWYEGTEPRSATINRMEALIAAIEAMPPEADLRRLKTVWNIPLSGKSFRATFNDGNIDISTLHSALVEKLNELSSRMAGSANSTQKITIQSGEAQLAEVDRRAYFR